MAGSARGAAKNLTGPARVTIARVAQRARVSKMTVSRVINQRPGVAPRLRARVQRIIDQLGYVPSASARSLAIAHTPIAGPIASGTNA